MAKELVYLIENGKTEEEAYQILTLTYEVETQQIRRDGKKILQELREKGWIV